jgi:hypothetical protein
MDLPYPKWGKDILKSFLTLGPKHCHTYGAHTRTSLARESDSARVPMSQTRPVCGSPRSYVCGEINPSPAPESSSPNQTRTCMGPFNRYRCCTTCSHDFY